MANEILQLDIQDHHVVMDNGILQVTLSKPDGNVTGIKYNSIDNVLEVDDKETHRGYWDLVWNSGTSGTTGTFDEMRGKEFEVMVQNEEQIELSFKRNYSFKDKAVPLNIDKRFIMLRNSSGFYSYAIYEHMREWPPFNLPQTRIVFKLRKDKFHYMAIADDRQRFMPLPEDRLRHRGKPLDFPEAVLLVNPKEPEFKGEMFLSAHYSGEDLVLKLSPDEPWKKVFGPVFFYLNSVSDGGDPLSLWEDAKTQMSIEVQSWPYSFPASEDFPPPNQRGRLTGKLFVLDRYINEEKMPATDAYVGLAAPGEAGSWQTENKGYQFWTKTDADGSFSIEHVRIGDYNLYAWVPGFIGDYRYDVLINVSPGSDMDVGDLVYEPPRNGPTLWEIGIPDRSAAEFYIPDPDPKYINKLYVNHPDRFRQYGLWERYAELYPDADLVYSVGVSDYTKDWFFAHVNRKRNDGSHLATTWEIKFRVDNIIDKSGTYTLRVALATANVAELQIQVNNPEAKPSLFTTGMIGHDNAIARHGIHGLYRLYSVDILGSLLVEGENTIFLSQIINSSSFNGVMYDYIRLEGPPSDSISLQNS
ncbi:probable rhamnogalacturonate lyase B isoform X2 [Cucumis melo]|uniref:Probable rhamnogalacturonate lyase B isoform X2 n=1 Tax=Cucumis melo TaxID=3656 RepID=A0ABM3KP19_CUCME|nr:probable rhamnogalacturonate lyase B isoform X2 [Cucumis melo]